MNQPKIYIQVCGMTFTSTDYGLDPDTGDFVVTSDRTGHVYRFTNPRITGIDPGIKSTKDVEIEEIKDFEMEIIPDIEGCSMSRDVKIRFDGD